MTTTTGTLDAGALVDRLRATFADGRTRPVEWRRAQLEGLHRLLVDREEELLGALAADLAKPPLEAYGTEIGFMKSDVRHALRHLDR